MDTNVKEKLQELGVIIVQRLEDDIDSDGGIIKRFDCRKDGTLVNAELYEDGHLDVYAPFGKNNEHETIFDDYLDVSHGKSTLLKIGDRIKINGWPMLKGLEDGRTYEVFKIFSYAGKDTYGLAQILASGKLSKKHVGHMASDIDRSIETAAWCDNNIAVVQKNLYSVKDWKGQEVSKISAWDLSEAKKMFSDLGYSKNATQPYSLEKKGKQEGESIKSSPLFETESNQEDALARTSNKL